MKSISDKLNTIDESNIQYIDLMDRPDLIWGTSSTTGNRVDFYKYTPAVLKEIKQLDAASQLEFQNLCKCSSGCRIRFKTNSTKVIFKVSLNRKYDYKKINLWNSSGFDVYEYITNEYFHKTVFGPMRGKNIFAESLENVDGKTMCIFCPTYNEIVHLYIGIEKNTELKSVPYKNIVPIIFYGNSITQGASASRSGNAMCNIVSRYLDRDIINFSISSCCKGQLSIADIIGKLNCKAIIIDYTRNAYDGKEFKDTYSLFYKRIRAYHPNIPIILMTVSDFRNWKGYFPFDDIVQETYENAISQGENTYILNQKKLFNESEYDLITVDGVHFNDFGMYAIANKICKLLRQNDKSI